MLFSPSLPVTFHFSVSISGFPFETSFQEVRGIETSMETETVREGGENNFVFHLPKGTTHPDLELKRGLVPTGSGLYLWCCHTLNCGFASGIIPQLILVHLLNAENQPLCSWSFENAYPVKWSLGELNSTKNEVLVESISLKYTEMFRMPI